MEEEIEISREEKLGTVLESLRAPLDPELIKTRAGYGGSGQLSYVEGFEVMNLLDDKAPGWGLVIKEIRYIDTPPAGRDNSFPGSFLVTAQLIIEGVVREGASLCSVGKNGDYEMALKTAATDALKRAAVLFGVARELYDKPDVEQPVYQNTNPSSTYRNQYQRDTGGNGHTNGSFDSSRMTGMATEKQVAMIQKNGNSASIIQDLFGDDKAPGALTKGEASQVIDRIFASRPN